MAVNWCPALGTVLANEEVKDGLSEVGGHPVVRKPMKQWMLRITAYAQRLLDDLEGLDWPEYIKDLQRNWIGRSDGAEVDFALEGHEEKLRVFTTRPDTLFGATYMVLSPEHPWVEKLTTEEQRDAVEAYRAKRPARATATARSPRTRPASSRGSYAHQSGHGQAHSHLDRRLRDDGLRHRRHHGRARPGRARLGIRREVRPADHPHRAAARRLGGQGLHRRRAWPSTATSWTGWAWPKPRPR